MRKAKKSKRRRQKLTEEEVPKLEALKQISLNAAGLDIGDEEIYAAVPEGRDEVSVRVFRTFTIELYALADWLVACGVDTVAMESTGVYWIPIFEILEERGFEVYRFGYAHYKSGQRPSGQECERTQERHPRLPVVAAVAYLRFIAGLLSPSGRHLRFAGLGATPGEPDQKL